MKIKMIAKLPRLVTLTNVGVTISKKDYRALQAGKTINTDDENGDTLMRLGYCEKVIENKKDSKKSDKVKE